MKFLILSGLPGSGKTTLALSLLGPNDFLFDDLSVRYKWDEFVRMVNVIKPETVIIAEPKICDVARRASLAEKIDSVWAGAEISYIFFENDPEQCVKNVLRRDDGREVFNTIKRLTKIYTYPADADVRPVYKENNEH